MPPVPAPQSSTSPSQLVASSPSAGGLSLEELVLAHHATVYRYACRLTGSPVDAEDLTQQTFLIAQQKLHQLREVERAAGWLLAIGRTTYLKWLAKRAPLLCDGDLADVPAPCRDIDEVDSEELAKGLAELPAELRLTLAMFYFEDLSYQEIARELEIPIGTVMSRLSRAKERLRQRLGAASPAAASLRPSPAGEESSTKARATSTAP